MQLVIAFNIEHIHLKVFTIGVILTVVEME